MGTVWFAGLAILIVVFQASVLVTAEEPTCVPGFQSDVLIFKVARKHLRPPMTLGKVGFTDCTGRTEFSFSSDDSRFTVQTDGTLMVKRSVVLHEGHQDFFIKSWDSQGCKMTLLVRVMHHGHHHENNHNVKRHHGDHKHHNHQHHFTEVHSETAADPQVPILHFPKHVDGLKRRKRDWVIPDLNVPENDRGPYPLRVSQIRSNEDKVKKIYYSITGPGADQDPIGLFTMDRASGTLYITEPLDREKQAKYTFQAHAVADGSVAEDPMDITVNVIDQNDNKPTFTQDTFLGEVPEASPKGYEVIKVVATDRDEPNNANSDIRYRIVSQEPELPTDSLFVINPVNGAIRVNAGGLDREKYPNYTLVVQAADMVGEGLTGEAKVILTVTDTNDNAPAFTQSSTAADPQVPILHFPKHVDGLKRRKRDWVIPDLNVPENDRGPYPLRVSQIRSNEDKVKKIYYSITGPGADQDPIGLFTMDRASGTLYITEPLDREKQAKYTFQAHAVADGSVAEDPMDITVNVIDQNDNKPTFTQDTFLGEVPEASPKGYEVIKVVATDRDEPNNANSDIRYRIVSQEPELPTDSLFVINPVNGAIRVNAGGLDREKYPNYTLVVQAADMVGEGLTGEAKVILTVTDTNDNAPAFTQSSTAADPQVPILHFPKHVDGLKRRKRDWVIPDLNVPENDRGPYPLRVSQIRSNEDKVKKIYYSITGPGADQDPIGLFTMDRASGTLYITEPLDREKQAKYTFQAHAVADGSVAEDPMDITVNVIDQNDNKPTFTQDTFLGEVPEASPKGYEVIKVVATDRDEPNNANSDIRYRIVSQEPELPTDSLFVINPVNGAIRVNAGGLDREKYPNYTLVVQAADMVGEGLTGEAKVILTVTDTNDNAPAFTQSSTAADPQVPILHFPKHVDGLKRRKRDWVIPDLNVPENDRGPYPLRVSQIRSNEDKVKKIYYSITGPGADQDPIGLFTMDRASGTLYITEPLDREKQAKYTFQAHAVADGSVAEDPMDITVNVIDQNDNKPTFTQDTFLGEVPEASPKGYEVIKVVATDRDEPNNANSDIRYRIMSQEPELPTDSLFVINPVNGAIRVNAGGLDREKYPKYTLVVQAADLVGEGMTGEAKVILTVTDSNDNAPAFTQSSYEAEVTENAVDIQVTKMSVTDDDEPNSPAWNAKFYIVSGDPEGLFTVKTGSNKHEGIISTAKGLDFEKSRKHTLLVRVENEVPFATKLPTATATVVVNVLDVNEAPIFDPIEKIVVKREDLGIDNDVVQYIASDPDTARNQKVMYRIIRDPAGWLNVDKDSGLIKVKSAMDRESSFVKDNKYTALIGAYDNDEVPATGTGTLIIQLTDVNDNAPTIDERELKVCNKNSASQLLSVTDKDGPPYGAPYSVSLQGLSKNNWTARMNDSKTGILLNLATELASGKYTVVLRVSDADGLFQDSTVQATVCDCSGEEVICKGRVAGGSELPVILGILGGILLLLMLVLLLLLFARRRRGEKKEPLLQDDDIRDNIYYYDEEGGGEDDQDYDLSVLHRGLDNRPEVFRNDVVPNFMPATQYQYRPRPANPEEIGNFIDDNLKAADNDPTAPPYDSLLVFDYEGGGSDAGSISSLNSSSSGDQDYDCLSEWGPRFKKLADMYGGGEEEML